MLYRYTPNYFARRLFDLRSEIYENCSLTLLLEDCMGKEKYRKYMVAQDPFANGRSVATVTIIVNPEEKDSGKWVFAPIGIVSEINED